jgi:hypothetical protein
VMEICEQVPPATEVEPGHTVSCHLYPTSRIGTES